MKLELGNKIRELRRRDGRTQEAVAEALGVTSQAVSRWESNGSYPDMEIMPAIANYFGVTIDELFGYSSDRDRRINNVIAKIGAYGIKGRGDDDWVDECLAILREGLAEFPQNERLLITLADTLSEAGWRRHKEWLYYDEEGYLQHEYDTHKKNEYWIEAVKICENLINTAEDNKITTRAISILVKIYRNFGETGKAVSSANRMPGLRDSKEILLAYATDGKEQAKYIGEALLEMASVFVEQLVYGLVNNIHHYETDMPIAKIKGAIEIFYLICDDEDFGEYNCDLVTLYLYLSRVQWERGYHDEAFDSLEKALEHARAFDAQFDGECGGITHNLSVDWPMISNPDYSQVEKEIKADPRWMVWVEKT